MPCSCLMISRQPCGPLRCPPTPGSAIPGLYRCTGRARRRCRPQALRAIDDHTPCIADDRSGDPSSRIRSYTARTRWTKREEVPALFRLGLARCRPDDHRGRRPAGSLPLRPMVARSVGCSRSIGRRQNRKAPMLGAVYGAASGDRCRTGVAQGFSRLITICERGAVMALSADWLLAPVSAPGGLARRPEVCAAGGPWTKAWLGRADQTPGAVLAGCLSWLTACRATRPRRLWRGCRRRWRSRRRVSGRCCGRPGSLDRGDQVRDGVEHAAA